MTHRQIAAAAGVSQTTVSFALRNNPKISISVRDRVRRIARSLGYRPNAYVATLMAHVRASRAPHQIATIGFIYTQPTRKAIHDDYVVCRYFTGARNRAADLGYGLDPFWLGDRNMSEKRLSMILAHRGIAGVVLGPLAFDTPSRFAGGHIHMDWSRLVTVALGRTIAEPEVDRACHDNFSAMLELMERLIGRGYRRIGLALHHKDDDRVNHLWLAGFLTRLHGQKLIAPLEPLLAREWSYEVFRSWYRENHPDCVISHGIITRLWLEKCDAAKRRKTGFATVSWNPSKIGLAGMYQNYERIGAMAINMVVGRLQRNEPGLPESPHSLLVKGRWVEGKSIRSSAIQTAIE